LKAFRGQFASNPIWAGPMATNELVVVVMDVSALD
jgi:hypothetical protein